MAAETMRIAIDVDVEDNTGPGFESAKKKVTAFDKVVQQTQSRLKSLTGSRWDATVSLKDKTTSVLSAVESKIKSAAGKAWNIAIGIKDTFTAPFRGILNMLKNPLVQAGAFLGVSFGLKDTADG